MKHLFTTKRLGFRHWNQEDKIPFAKMNSDKQVMQYFPKTLSSYESDHLVDRICHHFEKYGYGLYAVDSLDSRQFIGFIGFQHTTFQEFFTPCIEIGWRLSPLFWKRGLATEGAKKCLHYGFREIGFNDIYSFTAKTNKPSEKVMKNIGMSHIGEFHHPLVAPKSSLWQHVLYHVSSKSIKL